MQFFFAPRINLVDLENTLKKDLTLVIRGSCTERNPLDRLPFTQDSTKKISEDVVGEEVSKLRYRNAFGSEWSKLMIEGTFGSSSWFKSTRRRWLTYRRRLRHSGRPAGIAVLLKLRNSLSLAYH